MTPGAYLQKRRVLAGYSIRSLERELAMIDGFGRASTYRDGLRVQLRLLSAESSEIYLDPRELEFLAPIIRLDPAIYRDLVDVAEGRSPAPAHRLCSNCGCSELLPCREPGSGVPGRACGWANEDTCTCCVNPVRRNTDPDPVSVLIVEDQRRTQIPVRRIG